MSYVKCKLVKLYLGLLPGLLTVNSSHLTQHDSGVTVHERNAGQTLTFGELVNHHGLLWLKDALSSIVGLQGNGALSLLTTGVLAHLPVNLNKTAGSATASDVADGRISALDLSGNVEDLHLAGEVLGDVDGFIGLVHHDVTNTGHVVLVESLDVHAGASSGGGVGGQELHFLTGLHLTLLHTAGEHITDTLDLVDTGQRKTHLLVWVTLGGLHEVVEAVLEAVDVNSLGLGKLDVLALPPAHLVGLGEEVVTVPSGDGEDGGTLLNERLGPANLDKHELHLIPDLIVAFLLVGGQWLGVHLVHADDELLDAKKIDETSVLAGLALHLTGLVVTLLDGNHEVTIGRNHEHADIGLGRTGNHILDEITVAGSVDHGVVVPIREEFLGGALDGHTTLTLVLLGVHVEREGEGALAELLSLGLELLHLTLGDTSELEEQATGGGRLSRVDVATDDHGHVLLF